MNKMDGQVSIFDQDTWCGKTSPELSVATKEKTSESSLKNSQKSKTKMPLFLCLKKENGQTVDASWVTDGQSLGAYSTHSFGESPKDVVGSHLSQILQEIESCEQKRKETPSDASRGVGADDRLGSDIYSVENHPNDSRVGINDDGKVQALTSRMGTVGGNVPMVMQLFSKSKRAQSATDNETWVESDTANTLNTFDVGDARATDVVVSATVYGFDGYNQSLTGDVSTAIRSSAADSDHVPNVIYAIDRGSFNQGKNAKLDFEISERGVASSLVAQGPSAVSYRHVVRRLTPLEFERLQGYPDGWTDIGEWTDTKGKKHQTSDTARYRALGNSIALPPWKWVLKRLCACYERDATMASLFDGIGGFPYLWEQINGKGSCLWASEIEEFPIAVTKLRIGE